MAGEPLASWNIEATRALSKEAWKIGKDVWVWTGFTMETLDAKQMRALDFTDVLIDGPFIEEKKSLECLWRGSTNQRIWKKNEMGVWVNEEDCR